MHATPVIIGLRTWEYGPRTTSFDVGSHGASVPCPTVTNSLTVQTASARPSATNTPPSKADTGSISAPLRQTMIAGIATVTNVGRSKTART
jgi:hypothetical protein